MMNDPQIIGIERSIEKAQKEIDAIELKERQLKSEDERIRRELLELAPARTRYASEIARLQGDKERRLAELDRAATREAQKDTHHT